VLISRIDMLVMAVRIGIGIKSTISISKTMKIIASRKNRIENGIRALWFGSNPHSNGEDFSRLVVARADVIQAIINTMTGKVMATNEDRRINSIY